MLLIIHEKYTVYGKYRLVCTLQSLLDAAAKFKPLTISPTPTALFSSAITGMEDPSAVQDQVATTAALTSLPPTSEYTSPNSQATSINKSANGSYIDHESNGPTHHENVLEEDGKPGLSQGQAIVIDTESQSTEPGRLASEPPTPTQTIVLSERHTASNGEGRSSSTVPPTPPAKSAVPVSLAESTAGRDSSEVLPPAPVEKPSARQKNGLNGASPKTPTTPLSALSHKRSLTISKGHTVSVVLISSALEIILSSREAKRSADLRDSAQHALEMVRSGQGGDRPREIFEPLRLACETRNEKLMIASLDCISKLISYSFFAESSSTHSLPSPPPSPGPQSPGSSHAHAPSPSLVDLVAHTVTACHTETTPETVSLQIVKALLSLVLSPTILVHQSSLLKAVRTVYNVFLLSTDPVNQMVAQGGLTQMVHHVFTRCKTNTSTDQVDTTSAFRASVTEENTIDASRRGSLATSQSDPDSLSYEARIASHREVEAVLNPMNESVASLPAQHHEVSSPNGTYHEETTSAESQSRPTL